MFFRWLKKILPHSLYGRAALILLVPIVSLQAVVSVIFIQRHFNSITEQMTGLAARELAHLVAAAEASASPEAAAEVIAVLAPALLIEVRFPAETQVEDARNWDDFTGRRVMRSLYAALPMLAGADLTAPGGRGGQVVLSLASRHGLIEVRLDRARFSANNPHQLLVTMVVFALLLTTVAYFFLRNQLRPIKRLGEAAEAFGHGRVMPYKVSGSTEVRAAGQAFLDMRARIERQIESRTLMLSGISHDLRTPLTRFKLGLAMLEDDAARAALERDVGEMEKLVEAFLDFAADESQAGESLPRAEPADPGLLLGQVARNARRAGQAVEIGRIDPTGPVALRPLSVTRALDNLLSNAARYAERARVSLEAGAQRLCFVIEDDGPGIAPGEREQALKPFSRLDRARNQDRGAGVGLGLAIAADIARAHGGTLRLGRSADLGGLRAELELPRRDARAGGAGAATSEGAGRDIPRH